MKTLPKSLRKNPYAKAFRLIFWRFYNQDSYKEILKTGVDYA
jgi:hypothetical protein